MKELKEILSGLDYAHSIFFRNDKEDLLRMVNQKENFNFKTERGDNILHYLGAVGYPDTEADTVLTILMHAIESGCKLSDQNTLGQTPLQLEAFSFHSVLLDYAIEIGATDALNIQDKSGNTILHYYASNGRQALWVKAVNNGTNLWIKNNEGLLSHEEIATSNNTASGKKQFIKAVETLKSKFPQASVEPETLFAEPAWTIPASVGDKIKLLGTQKIDLSDGTAYLSLYPINDKYALLNTDNFYNIINLQDGSIKHRIQRFAYNVIEYAYPDDGIWYGSIEGNGNTYIIAIDPEKGFDTIEGTSLWLTSIGSSSMRVESNFYVENNVLLINASSALLALDTQTGRILWRAKPKGRTTDTMPFVHNGLVYTQCIVHKKNYLCAIDIKTGSSIDSENMELPYPLHKGGYQRCEQRPLVYKEKLYYFSEDEEYNILFTVFDLEIQKVILIQQMLEGVSLDYENFKLSSDGDIVNILIDCNTIIAKYEIKKGTLTINNKLKIKDRSICTPLQIINNKLYIEEYHNDEEYVVEVYNCETGNLLQSVALPKENDYRIRKPIITQSSIIYVFGVVSNEKQGELYMLC